MATLHIVISAHKNHTNLTAFSDYEKIRFVNKTWKSRFQILLKPAEAEGAE